ncbi:GCN5-related N-acetyltransferase [Desulfosarcina variabilis str. Montpellier]|uniref:GNAT family N-acetyltransferase n=1 Tax=Desulfosarcina variabilis TaxID=2300 RepID=UPI003AFA8678
MIRKIEKEEINDVLNIWINASIQAHNFIDEEFWKSKTVDMRETYIPNSDTYIFKENEIIKGFFSLHGNTLAAMFVSPEFHSNGIGREMMEKAKSLRNKLELTVYKENPKSIEFYKKCGFQIIKEKVDVHTGHIEVLMNFSS